MCERGKANSTKLPGLSKCVWMKHTSNRIRKWWSITEEIASYDFNTVLITIPFSSETMIVLLKKWRVKFQNWHQQIPDRVSIRKDNKIDSTESWNWISFPVDYTIWSVLSVEQNLQDEITDIKLLLGYFLVMPRITFSSWNARHRCVNPRPIDLDGWKRW